MSPIRDKDEETYSCYQHKRKRDRPGNPSGTPRDVDRPVHAESKLGAGKRATHRMPRINCETVTWITATGGG